MHIDLECIFWVKPKSNRKGLIDDHASCFRHAVQAALEGHNVEVEVDEIDYEYDLRDKRCKMCEEE